jgi:hypothetical protein
MKMRRNFFAVPLCGLAFFAMNALAGGANEQTGGREDDDGPRYQDHGDVNIDAAALVAYCGLGPKRIPSDDPFNRDGELKQSWTRIEYSRFEFSRKNAGAGYSSALCEMFILQSLSRGSNGRARFRDRCELVRDFILAESEGGSEASASALGNFSALDAFFTSSGGDSYSDDSACDDPESLDNPERFACRIMSLREVQNSPNSNKQFASAVKIQCERAGADMRRRMNHDEYASFASSGISVMGGYCGGGGGAGVVVLQSPKKSTLETVTDGLLGAMRIGLPVWSLSQASKRQHAVSLAAIDANKELGFPSAVTAGSGIAGGYAGMGGYGYGGYGVGGAGYGHGGCGGGFTGGGGGCPYGYGYGNGGMIVGGGGFGGGGMVGGGCGIPPYAGGGCGGGMGGGLPGAYGMGGMPGYGAGGGFPGAYGTGGAYGPGGAGGFNPYGTGLGGYNPYGGGGNGFPGPLGTGNGGNGWGGGNGAYGPGGMYGGPSTYGAQNPFNAQQAQQQARAMQQYAAMLQRQAQTQQASARRYEQNLEDLQKVYAKSYQSWMAYQNSASAMNGQSLMGTGMMGGGGYYGGSTYMGGGGLYYPPYTSGGSGTNFNLGIQYRGPSGL